MKEEREVDQFNNFIDDDDEDLLTSSSSSCWGGPIFQTLTDMKKIGKC